MFRHLHLAAVFALATGFAATQATACSCQFDNRSLLSKLETADTVFMAKRSVTEETKKEFEKLKINKEGISAHLQAQSYSRLMGSISEYDLETQKVWIGDAPDEMRLHVEREGTCGTHLNYGPLLFFRASPKYWASHCGQPLRASDENVQFIDAFFAAANGDESIIELEIEVSPREKKSLIEIVGPKEILSKVEAYCANGDATEPSPIKISLEMDRGGRVMWDVREWHTAKECRAKHLSNLPNYPFPGKFRAIGTVNLSKNAADGGTVQIFRSQKFDLNVE